MEVTKTTLLVFASVLLLACSSLSQECGRREMECNNRYVDNAARVARDKDLICENLKNYKRCLYRLDCVPDERKERTIQQAKNNLYGIECDLNGASRSFGISMATITLTAMFGYLAQTFHF